MSKKIILVGIFIMMFICISACHKPNKFSVIDNELSIIEIRQIKEIDEDLLDNEKLIELKKMGYLNEFISVLNEEYKMQKNEYVSWQTDMLNFWRLSPDETVASLETKAQDYLDKYHAGVKVGDEEFKKLVDYYMKDTTTPTAKKAREEYEFGALYCYMSLYEQYVQEDVSTSPNTILENEVYSLKLREISEQSFDGQFDSMKLLHQFMYDKGLNQEEPKQLTTKN